jgi:hypothetical protein
MSDTALTLFWADEEVGEAESGLLTAEVKAGGYAGHGSAFFRREFLRKTFVAKLRRPITRNRPVALEAESENQGVLLIRIAPFSGTGALLAEIRLSAPAQSEHPMGGLENELTVRFVTNREAVLRFASAIEAQLDGGDIPSILTGL